jgi:hypothetical protein
MPVNAKKACSSIPRPTVPPFLKRVDTNFRT